ncbi:MAG: HNH endonuclease [Opitutaceae bacterium]|nr:HNH endonuclease [Opitutaceae bacterium]
MAIYNTDSDAANTAVRAYLTKVGEFYRGSSFNTSQGKAKADWTKIKHEVFSGCCAYCGKKTEKPTIEHLIMFNRSEFGLHHPGNVVPACSPCNSSRRAQGGKFPSWEDHLRRICSEGGESECLNERKRRIMAHHCEGEFAYPILTREEQNAIRVIAESIYDSVQLEIRKGLKLYQKLDQAFVKEGVSHPMQRGKVTDKSG